MAIVRVLPDTVADMIAAGEVVDRPASVVKELCENSIDAGGSHVAVRIRGAGREEVAVEDDGSGMDEADALLCLRRHATSKIASAADLERIHTLGFRGEALASIASVSRLTLVTRQAGSDSAVRVEVEGGTLSRPTVAPGAPGTAVTVRDLFFNTPARRKFLKSDATEVRNVVDAVTRLALVHPGVGFTLESEGRRLLTFPQGQTLAIRAAEAVGATLDWREEGEEGRRVVFAFTPPHEGRGRRDGLKFFVNRRAVNDRILFGAVMEGYRGLIAEGRYPTALLWLDLDPALVDVNVHPAKREVRFSDEGAVWRLVSGAVARALASLGEPATPARAPAPWGETPAREEPRSSRVEEALAGYGRRYSAGGVPQPAFGSGYGAGRGREGLAGYPGREAAPLQSPAPAPEQTGIFSSLRHLGAFDATYLIFEDMGTRELVLVDQHAAHERILYEELLRASGAPGASQQLLVPVVVECDPGALALFPERAGDLALVGIRAEPFGPRAVSVVSAPVGLDQGSITAIVLDFLGAPIPEEANRARSLAERAAARAACAGAVKSRRELHPSEVAELMKRLGNLENPTHCPHGRPLLVRLAREKVAALFLRR